MDRHTRRKSAGTVLVLRALGLGDTVTGIPALRGLRRAFPRHHLVLAARADLGSWLTDLQLIDRVVPAQGLAPIRGLSSPDIAVNLHGSGPQSHEWLRMTGPGRMLGFASAAAGFTDGPKWDDTAHEVDRWCVLARWAGGRCGRTDLRLAIPGGGGASAPAIVHPGAAAAARQWPVRRWRQVVQALTGARPVLVTGTVAERELCAAVADRTGAALRIGQTTVAQLADLVAHAGLVVSGDTGIAHLATAYGIPSVTLFGPMSPQRWGPAIDPQLHRVIWHGRHDGDLGDPHGDTVDERLAAITVPEVLAAIDAVPPDSPGGR